MKNKLVRTLSLGVACFMLSMVISVSIPKNSAMSLASNSTHRVSVIPFEDPPSHSVLD